MGEVNLVGLVPPDDLYLTREGVPVARPWMFGDVISDVSCSRGGSPASLSMIVTHPCSMRRGGQLRPEIVVAEIGTHDQRVSESKWCSGFFDLFPLPGFDASTTSPVVVRFLSLHSVNSLDLEPSRRVAALSELGVASVLQRWIHQLSRDKVDMPTLVDLIAPVMAEADMQEEWCEAAVRVSGEVPVTAAIDAAAFDFQTILGVPGSGGLRDALSRPAGRPDVRRKISVARREKYGS